MDGAEDHCDASESCMLVSMMLDSADSHGEEIDWESVFSCFTRSAPGSGGGELLGATEERADAVLPRGVLVPLVFWGDLPGDFGVLIVCGLRSSAAFLSRAACSSGDGTIRLIRRRPAERFSMSLADSVGVTSSESLEGK